MGVAFNETTSEVNLIELLMFLVLLHKSQGWYDGLVSSCKGTLIFSITNCYLNSLFSKSQYVFFVR